MTKTHKNDSMLNVATKLNTAQDKQTQINISTNILTREGADNLYQSDAMSRKLVDRVVNEGIRKWIDLLNIEPEQKTVFNNYMDQLQVKNAIREAWRYARLYGGGAILINVDDGLELSDPLNLNLIKKIKSFLPLSRYHLFRQSTIIDDIDSPYFGDPEYYSLSESSTGEYINQIHHTRLIKIHGAYLPFHLYQYNNYWHDSVLSGSFTAIRNYSQAHDMVSSMVQDYRERTLSIEGLDEILSMPDGESILIKRMQIQDKVRSSLKTNIIGSNDKMEVLTTNFSSISDILDRVDKRLVASTNLPHTIVLGDSPIGGLNNSGQNENRDWYDFVSDQQEDHIRGPIKQILNLLMHATDGPTNGQVLPDLTFVFNSLWQMDDKERAEIEKIVAEKDAIYYNINVLTENEIANNRYGGATYSQDTVLDDIERDDMNIEPEPDAEE